MNKTRVLLVQYKIIYLDVKANLAKFKRIIRKYKDLRPDLIVFPEYALTGPLYSNYFLAFDNNEFIFDELSLLAKKNNVNIIPGSFVRKEGNNMYNSTCLIHRDGQINGFYNKKCLWSSEKKFLNAVDDMKVFETDFGRIAIQICADLHSSSISDSYRSFKPEIIINLAMWSEEDMRAVRKKVPKNIELIQTEYLSRARAIENRSYIIFCNFADTLTVKAKTGRQYQETSIGNSLIVNPYGEVIARSSSKKEEIIFAELDLSKSHWSKYTY